MQNTAHRLELKSLRFIEECYKRISEISFIYFENTFQSNICFLKKCGYRITVVIK
jgi:hypothetical protein